MSNAVERFVFREPSTNSRNIVERGERTIFPSYTCSYGFTISHGEGAEVWDIDGNRYIDFAAGMAVLSTGFSHPPYCKSNSRTGREVYSYGKPIADFSDEIVNRLKMICGGVSYIYQE